MLPYFFPLTEIWSPNCAGWSSLLHTGH